MIMVWLLPIKTRKGDDIENRRRGALYGAYCMYYLHVRDTTLLLKAASVYVYTSPTLLDIVTLGKLQFNTL